MKHHYLPVFYLAGFTAKQTRDDILHVLDLKARKQHKAKPHNTGFENDYYEADIEGDDPHGFEKALAAVEGTIAPIMSDVLRKRELPTGDAFDVLLNFVALMTARVPGSRNAISRPFEKIGKTVLQNLVQSKEEYEARLDRMKKDVSAR